MRFIAFRILQSVQLAFGFDSIDGCSELKTVGEGNYRPEQRLYIGIGAQLLREHAIYLEAVDREFPESTQRQVTGLVVWGGTADGQRVYYPLQQPGGGLKALELESGKVDWNAPINADRRGQAGPASSIPGAVFTGGWDGILRAVDAAGKVIWSDDSKQDYQTVNGVIANGGSFGSAGPVIAGGMVYVSSGYTGIMGGSQGNVVLAFGVE